MHITSTGGFLSQMRRWMRLGRLFSESRHYNNHHPDLKADTILANPPFNVINWRRDPRKDITE